MGGPADKLDKANYKSLDRQGMLTCLRPSHAAHRLTAALGSEQRPAGFGTHHEPRLYWCPQSAARRRRPAGRCDLADPASDSSGAIPRGSAPRPPLRAAGSTESCRPLQWGAGRKHGSTAKARPNLGGRHQCVKGRATCAYTGGLEEGGRHHQYAVPPPPNPDIMASHRPD